MARAKPRVALPAQTRGVSGDAAGRDGCWRPRCRVAQGVEKLVVDASRLEGKRRQRRAKPDRLDGHKLLMMLLRYCAGATRVWSVVRAPSGADDERRRWQPSGARAGLTPTPH